MEEKLQNFRARHRFNSSQDVQDDPKSDKTEPKISQHDPITSGMVSVEMVVDEHGTLEIKKNKT